ncbi:hypothetical protein Efla_006015 [Eimeria flavescens]
MSLSGSPTPHPMHSIIMELIVCSRRFPGPQLRRFVEVPVPKDGFPERPDLEFCYALTDCRRQTKGHAWEDCWRRWTAFHDPRLPATLNLFPASPNDSVREKSEAEERNRDRFRRGDPPAARSPRSPPARPVSSPGEQGPVRATEVPRLQSSPSPGVSTSEGPPSSARSSPQESADQELPAASPACGEF